MDPRASGFTRPPQTVLSTSDPPKGSKGNSDVRVPVYPNLIWGLQTCRPEGIPNPGTVNSTNSPPDLCDIVNPLPKCRQIALYSLQARQWISLL